MPPFAKNMTVDEKAEAHLRAKLKELGESHAVTTWLRRYGRVTTWKSYAAELSFYSKWLRRERGVARAQQTLFWGSACSEIAWNSWREGTRSLSYSPTYLRGFTLLVASRSLKGHHPLRVFMYLAKRA